jgi:RNA polymerase sigma factor (TIGR02999 family)
MSEITHVLAAMEQGDPQAASQLLPLVYDALRKLAAHKLALELPGQTLQPTALVHEAYLRLVLNETPSAPPESQWSNRGHFFAAAAEAMRRILVEQARRKKRLKHGGGLARVDLPEHDLLAQQPPEDILALDEALTGLAREDPEVARVVQLHFFAGLPIEQAADTLGISRATAYRQWAYARSWLRCAIEGEQPPG